MTKISSTTIKKKTTPTIEDTVFGGDMADNGEIVRYDMETLAALIKLINGDSPTAININSYFPSGW
jgi:hypothetical protein